MFVPYPLQHNNKHEISTPLTSRKFTTTDVFLILIIIKKKTEGVTTQFYLSSSSRELSLCEILTFKIFNGTLSTYYLRRHFSVVIKNTLLLSLSLLILDRNHFPFYLRSRYTRYSPLSFLLTQWYFYLTRLYY